jgi:DNA-binding GntR family transcriptional regulator
MIDRFVLPKKVKGRRVAAGAESLASKAYEQIRDEILQGNLPVGAILSRRKLADRLNMSFLPITEALQRLEAEGLVESRPRIGTRVRIPSKEDIIDSYVIREALETQAARLCCEQMTPEERESLKLSARHLDSLYEASASEKEDSRFLFSVHTYHMQFHTQIAQLASSSGLLKAIEREHVLVYNWLYDTAAQRKSLPPNFHVDLANAICSGNANKADKAMRNHVRYGLHSVIESLGTVEVPNSWRHKRGRDRNGDLSQKGKS